MPKKTEEQVITTKEKETILPASPEKLAPHIYPYNLCRRRHRNAGVH